MRTKLYRALHEKSETDGCCFHGVPARKQYAWFSGPVDLRNQNESFSSFNKLRACFHTSADKKQDECRNLSGDVSRNLTLHRHPMFSLQRKSHRFGPGAPDLGVIFEQDPLRLTGFIRGTVPDKVPLISSGAPYPVRCL